jgi:glyoxylase-like metal-dependent hydrolase (beta-lactamase superfamily II)
MTLRIADRWFDRTRIDDDITLLWEPHVASIMRCNIWHVRGRERDLMIDTGMGIMSLREAAHDLLEKPVVAVATHGHADHIGSHHEFDATIAHRLEADWLSNPRSETHLVRAWHDKSGKSEFRVAHYDVGEGLVTALPYADFDVADYDLKPARNVQPVEDGSIVETGDRRFEVLHLPGHSPGSIGLWEATTGTLFSGDALYDGELFDAFDHSDVPTYIRTMERLRELPVTVVHAGHCPSFGRERLIELCDEYLALRQAG